jgi:hypothetical protein
MDAGSPARLPAPQLRQLQICRSEVGVNIIEIDIR